MSLEVQFLCFLLCLYSVSGLPVCGEENNESFFINSEVLPFQDELEEIFRNFNESETGQSERLERFSELLKTIDPYGLDDLARMEVENTNRVSFVVSLTYKMKKIDKKYKFIND